MVRAGDLKSERVLLPRGTQGVLGFQDRSRGVCRASTPKVPGEWCTGDGFPQVVRVCTEPSTRFTGRESEGVQRGREGQHASLGQARG